MTNFTTSGIRSSEHHIEVAIETEGEPEGLAEKVHMAAHDAAARALQAVDEKKLPADCDGIGISIDWEGVIENRYGDYGEVPTDA